MNLDDRITKLKELFAQREEIDRQIAECMGIGPTVEEASVRRKGKPGKRIAGNPCKLCGRVAVHASDCPRFDKVKKGKEITQEIERFHAGKKQHPETGRIEQLLVEGKSVTEVLESVQVSSPTVYVIKARLKAEGRLN